jgi:hypothetical protein
VRSIERIGIEYVSRGPLDWNAAVALARYGVDVSVITYLRDPDYPDSDHVDVELRVLIVNMISELVFGPGDTPTHLPRAFGVPADLQLRVADRSLLLDGQPTLFNGVSLNDSAWVGVAELADGRRVSVRTSGIVTIETLSTCTTHTFPDRRPNS